MEQLLTDYLRDAPAYSSYKTNAYQFVQQYDRRPVLADVFSQLEKL